MSKITLDLLEKIGACEEGIYCFTMLYGEEGAVSFTELIADERVPDDYKARLGINCPAGVEGATWEARMAVMRDDRQRSWLGTLCPAGVEGATWEARLAVQRDEYKAWFGRLCPGGVEGSTLEARLALQSYDWERDYVRKHFGKITKDLLEKIGACEEGIDFFIDLYGESGAVSFSEIAKDERVPDDYKDWLGINCPAGVEGATWQARLALRRNDKERAWLGRVCPAGVEGATWDARLALQRNDRERAWLGRSCPAGVDGATLEARLSVQRNDDEWERDYVRKHFSN